MVSSTQPSASETLHDVDIESGSARPSFSARTSSTTEEQGSQHQPQTREQKVAFFCNKEDPVDHDGTKLDATALKTQLTKLIPTQRPGTKAPKETLKAVYEGGRYKAGLSLDTLMLQSFMAGIYIGMAGQLHITVGGGLLGACLFPTGLIAVVLTSGELFTGDALVFIASLLGRQIKFRHLVRNWTVSWMLNFVGCLLWAYLLSYASGAIEDAGKAETAIKIAEHKALQPLLHTFLKSIGANFLVCVGVWQATCAEEVAGKVLAMWFPVMGFVTMGFDHCIANQYFLPLGLMLGANYSVGRMFAALFVATAGNAIGGGILVGAVYWYVFDSLTTRFSIQQTLKSAGRSVRHFVEPHSNPNSHHLNVPPGLAPVPSFRLPTPETSQALQKHNTD